MISVEEALAKVLQFADLLESEQKPILDALGQVLGEDVRATIDVPSNDNSAMDGFAVRADSIRGSRNDKPTILSVIGEVPAGSVFPGHVKSGEAVRIMTGAHLPEGADTVVPFEDTDELDRTACGRANRLTNIGIRRELPCGCNIRRAGEDIRSGGLVLTKGTLIRPADIGVLASIGLTRVPVIRRPVVAILATGNEVTDLGLPLGPGKLYNSNSYGLAAAVQSSGGIPRLLGIAEDRVEPLTAALKAGLDSDMLITTGGVSLGDYDLVKDILAKEGKISFWTVRMKPGKPLAFGTFPKGTGFVPHLGLPGNPVSALISFELFARPAILKMMGRSDIARPMIKAVLNTPINNPDGRRVFARVLVEMQDGQYHASVTGDQGSGILTSMALADGLAVIMEHVSLARTGDIVDVMMLGHNSNPWMWSR